MEKNNIRKLVIQDLHFSYGKLEVLKGISFEIAEHDFVALIGANGAGKSTALKAIVGMIKPLKGSVFLEGKDLTNCSTRERLMQGIAYVPQGRKIFSSLTVKENLDLISNEYDHVLNFFPNLKKKIDEKAGSLSGGEQQMISIARALMLKPKFLLLDEPSLGLSPLFVEQIFETFTRINKEDKVGILLVEQNVNKALEHAHFAFLLELGKLKQKVTKKDLEDKDFKRTYLGI